MKKNTMLKILNPILFLSALFQLISVINMVVFYGEFLPIHKINGYVLLGLIFLHVILNWSWIVTNIFKLKKKK